MSPRNEQDRSGGGGSVPDGGAPADAELARLIGAVAAGDRAALRALYDAAAPKLLGIILRILQDRSAAEDALQEVFVRIWQRAGTYDPQAGPPLVWLGAIARHKAIDRLRQDKAARLTQAEEGWIERLADASDGETDLARRDALAHCLDTVDSAQRDCLVLAYCEGWSREELAARYDRPVNTIKTWLRRGLLSLRGCLEAA
ncbi:sigma-70 family RNA polymerase sigma factor [Methylorubrum thiocyanatum]|uniref:sigma-70 family RNA polymerase sigma factor n=1 Tax=Methylorubrum thiocyanatum TaxID=47958 RepID=UPI003839F4D8